MGLIADLQLMTTETTTYAEALERAYAAAVQQSQAMNKLEQNARAAATAMMDAAEAAETAAAQMQQAVTSGVNGMANAQQEAARSMASFNPQWNGQSEYFSADRDPQGSSVNQYEAKLAGLTDELINSNEAVAAAFKSFADYKMDVAAVNGRLDTAIAVRYDELKAQGLSKDQIQAFLKPMYDNLERLRGEYDSRLQSLKTAAETATSQEKAAQAADWRDAITNFSQKVIRDEIKGQTRVDEMALENLAKSLMETVIKGVAPTKTYEIKLGGGSIRTIDDPTDLIALIEELSRAKGRVG